MYGCVHKYEVYDYVLLCVCADIHNHVYIGYVGYCDFDMDSSETVLKTQINK